MKLDILLPCYKPRKNWDDSIVNAIGKLKTKIGSDAEITLYITNDGAPDKYYSPEALKRISDAVNGKFHFLKYDKNRGKGYSLRHLVKHADGDFMIYTDGDFPFGYESVAEGFRMLADGADVIMGRRNNSYGTALSPFRKCLSGGLKMLNRLFCGLPEDIQDTQAGLKGFNRKGREAFLLTTVDSFVFDTEFILIAWNRGLNISPLDVQLNPEVKLSSMGLKILCRELLCFMKVLWQVRVKKSYKK
ncbi:MAG: glycosyltransferase [Lentisphaerae bacterium]|nr:glycosyltransferase [Lentisphaerota bacterium]